MQQQQQQGIVKGDALQRIGGVCLIKGAILLLVLNAIFPRVDDPSDTQQVLTKFADNEALAEFVFSAFLVGGWVALMGFAGVYRSISTGNAAAWARVGFYGVLAGTAMAATGWAIGLAGVQAAADWAAAGSGAGTTEYGIAAALHLASASTFYSGMFVWMLATVVLAIGMVVGNIYPKWLGWPILVFAGATAVVALSAILSGESQATDVAFTGVAGLSTVWMLVLGVWLTRRAW